ncbi:Polymerase/histidinol phosphatase-like protein [Syncephalastrum racemosum]|uniref:Polymerase/histidinol phosphatase-like protein n=1 Tax=Syncephalastrum racemosum TaxID=13706 RepID=A0A1X2H998_SYNRA|nr:Polymerase/histidinol phosphatase-like protein [Syncephalastrum racemosum]
MQTDELDKKKTGSIALPIHDDVTAESSRSASTHYFDSRETSYEQERGRVRHYLHCAKPYLLGFSVRVAGLIVLLAVLIGLGLGLRYTEGMPRPEDDSNLVFDWRVDPASYLTPFNQSFQYNVLLDGHAHSTYSDGRMNVRQLLEWHIANGYNAVIVTDHNTIQGGLAAEKLALEEYADNITVIPGIEYSCCRIHMNLIDINESIPIGPPEPTDQELQQVIQRVHELGGLVIVNHIPWSNTTQDGYDLPRLPNHPSVEDLISWGVDGFEVVHADTFDYATYLATVKHNLIQMVGTDVHYPTTPATAWLAVQAETKTRSGIMQAIRARRTSFLADPAGTRQQVYPPSSAAYDRLLPLTGLGSYFSMFYTESKGMYSFQGTFCQPHRMQVHGNIIGWFIFWIIVGLAVYELVRAFIRWVTERLRLRFFA